MYDLSLLNDTVELDYVAVCLAEQIIRVRISAGHFLASSRSGSDPSALLTRPLYAVAATLGLEQRVTELVDEALVTAA
jgi:hypothetical protein